MLAEGELPEAISVELLADLANRFGGARTTAAGYRLFLPGASREIPDTAPDFAKRMLERERRAWTTEEVFSALPAGTYRDARGVRMLLRTAPWTLQLGDDAGFVAREAVELDAGEVQMVLEAALSALPAGSAPLGVSRLLSTELLATSPPLRAAHGLLERAASAVEGAEPPDLLWALVKDAGRGRLAATRGGLLHRTRSRQAENGLLREALRSMVVDLLRRHGPQRRGELLERAQAEVGWTGTAVALLYVLKALVQEGTVIRPSVYRYDLP